MLKTDSLFFDKRPTSVFNYSEFSPAKGKLNGGRHTVTIMQKENRFFAVKRADVDEIIKEFAAYQILKKLGVPIPQEILIMQKKPSNDEENEYFLATKFQDGFFPTKYLGQSPAENQFRNFLPIFLWFYDTAAFGEQGGNLLKKTTSDKTTLVKIDPEIDLTKGTARQNEKIFGVLSKKLFSKFLDLPNRKNRVVMYGSDPWAAFTGITFEGALKVSNIILSINVSKLLDHEIPSIPSAEILKKNIIEILKIRQSFFEKIIKLLELGEKIEKYKQTTERSEQTNKKSLEEKFQDEHKKIHDELAKEAEQEGLRAISKYNI